MQIYLIENMNRSICFAADTFEALGDVVKKHPKETWIIRPVEMKTSNIDVLRSKYIQTEIERIESEVADVLKRKHHIEHTPAGLIRSIAESAYGKSKGGIDISCAIDEAVEENLSEIIE